MSKLEVMDGTSAELNVEPIREQLESVIQDPVFRSSKRSVEFLRYVVEQTLSGAADQIKERTIGVEVFGRSPSYDTNTDHVVRTAAIELRKRLAIYYGKEQHRSELRMSLIPGSYIPHFSPPEEPAKEVETSPEPVLGPLEIDGARLEGLSLSAESSHVVRSSGQRRIALSLGVVLLVLVIAGWVGYGRMHVRSAQELFWKPVLETPGPVLLAVGDVPNGPPTPTTTPPGQDTETPLPTLHAPTSPTVPFGDTVTIARVVGILEGHGKKVVIRRESSSSFSDLREGSVVLIGAFNNEWSLRLTHQLRYTLSLDPDRHLIYIKDARNPSARTWSWATNQPTAHKPGPGGPVLQDYALISRIWNSDTGHVVIIVGGLYTYGTEAAGEFLDDPQWMQAVAKAIPPGDAHKNMQIVLGTTVTDDTPGPPRVLTVSVE